MCLFSSSSVRSTSYSNNHHHQTDSTESLAAGESENLPGQQNGRRRRRQWWLWDEQINELSAFMAVLFYLFGRFFQGLSNFYCTLWTVGKDKKKLRKDDAGQERPKERYRDFYDLHSRSNANNDKQPAARPFCSPWRLASLFSSTLSQSLRFLAAGVELWLIRIPNIWGMGVCRSAAEHKTRMRIVVGIIFWGGVGVGAGWLFCCCWRADGGVGWMAGGGVNQPLHVQ